MYVCMYVCQIGKLCLRSIILLPLCINVFTSQKPTSLANPHDLSVIALLGLELTSLFHWREMVNRENVKWAWSIG